MQLKSFVVYLRRKGGKSRERVEVDAASSTHAERTAIKQVIATKHPSSKQADWIVTSVETKP
jgi:hypothetical protein